MKRYFFLLGLAVALRSANGAAAAADPPAPFELGLEEILTVPLAVSGTPPTRSFPRLPLSFVRNDGQTDARTKFEVHGPGYLLSLEQTEIGMVLPGTAREHAERPGVRRPCAAFDAQFDTEPWAPFDPPTTTEGDDLADSHHHPKAPQNWRTPRPVGEPMAQSHLLRMKMVGAQTNAVITGEQELPGKFNYFLGNDPAVWRTNVPSFAKVRYRSVYPGIDLVFYSENGQPEYDFVVAPGADPSLIALVFEGPDKVDLGQGGELVLSVGAQEVRWTKPKVFQEIAGHRTEICGSYALKATGSDADPALGFFPSAGQSFAFNVAAYDLGSALVIDPSLVYGTFLGASDAGSSGSSVAVDGNGNVYVAGYTSSPNFPVKNALFPSRPGTSWSYFITKSDPQGQMIYSTYIGPSSLSNPRLAIDSLENVYLAGCTTSSQFPVVNALQPSFKGGTASGDAIVLKLNPSGSVLVYSTYLGGSGEDAAYAVAVDSAGNVHLAGETSSRNFPLTNAFQSQYRGGERAAFFAKLNASGTALVYSTYFGGTSYDYANAIAVDPEGNACIAGVSVYGGLTTKNAFQSTYGGGSDGFWARLNPTGALLSASYFGGSSDDRIHAIAVGKSGDLYLTGTSGSFDLPIENALQSQIFAAGGPYGGALTEFVARYRPSSNALVFSTYLGGSVTEIGRALALDSAENIYILGETLSPDFPTTTDALQTSNNGGDVSWGVGWEDVLSVLSADGSSLLYSSFLGGTHTDFGQALALDTKGNVYAAGATYSADFPIEQPVLPYPGTNSAFVAVFSPLVPMPPSLQIIRSGSQVMISWPTSAADFRLESNDTLSQATNWVPEPTPPLVVGDQNVVTLELSVATKFFRLRKL